MTDYLVSRRTAFIRCARFSFSAHSCLKVDQATSQRRRLWSVDTARVERLQLVLLEEAPLTEATLPQKVLLTTNSRHISPLR